MLCCLLQRGKEIVEHPTNQPEHSLHPKGGTKGVPESEGSDGLWGRWVEVESGAPGKGGGCWQDPGAVVGAGFPGSSDSGSQLGIRARQFKGWECCPEELIWNDNVIRKLQNPIRLIA